MEMNGGSSAPYLARTPCVPLFCALFNRGGDRRAFRLPGAGGDHMHCMVEPSPSHIRCRILAISSCSFSGANSANTLFRGRYGEGGKKRGVENLTNDTTPKNPKMGFGPPSCGTFLPPRLSLLCFSCTRIHGVDWVHALRGRTATQSSKKGSEKVLERVLGKGSQRGSEKGACCGFYNQERVLRRVLRRGSEKGVSRRCLERVVEYAPLGVRPSRLFLQGAPKGRQQKGETGPGFLQIFADFCRFSLIFGLLCKFKGFGSR